MFQARYSAGKEQRVGGLVVPAHLPWRKDTRGRGATWAVAPRTLSSSRQLSGAAAYLFSGATGGTTFSATDFTAADLSAATFAASSLTAAVSSGCGVACFCLHPLTTTTPANSTTPRILRHHLPMTHLLPCYTVSSCITHTYPTPLRFCHYCIDCTRLMGIFFASRTERNQRRMCPPATPTQPEWEMTVASMKDTTTSYLEH